MIELNSFSLPCKKCGTTLQIQVGQCIKFWLEVAGWREIGVITIDGKEVEYYCSSC